MNTKQLRFVSIGLLILLAGFYLYTDRQQHYYQSRALPAARQMLLDITQWEKSALTKHLSEEALQTINDQQLNKLLDHYRQFGKFQSLGALNFSRLTSALSLFGEKRINYAGSVQFDSGSAQLNMTLVELKVPNKPEQFKIYNLSIRR
ncbi:MAG: hypothetical protein JKY66_11115 [Spongiibacteraceae bacterium]|nr:hypothetical protein [Spongiibacteraceae bacterium]